MPVIVSAAAGFGPYFETTTLMGREDRHPNTFYEVKYRTPEGVVFDVTENGWRGAVKNVEPVLEKKIA